MITLMQQKILIGLSKMNFRKTIKHTMPVKAIYFSFEPMFYEKVCPAILMLVTFSMWRIDHQHQRCQLLFSSLSRCHQHTGQGRSTLATLSTFKINFLAFLIFYQNFVKAIRQNSICSTIKNFIWSNHYFRIVKK